MKQVTVGLSIFLLSLFSEGCSVYMAGHQPSKVDLSAFETGPGSMPRDFVISKLGVPTSSVKNEDGTRTDIYEFYEGSAQGWKVGRATFNALADIVTIGLWEVIATPTEMVLKGERITARADFDNKDILKKFAVLKLEKQENKEEPQPVDSQASR